MSEKTIVLNDLTKPEEIFKLSEYLRELYRLSDLRFVSVDYSATPTFDSDEGDSFLITLTGNITGITIKNAYKGRQVVILFKQDAVGGHTITGWPANVKLAAAAAIGGDDAGEYSTITLLYDDTNWVEISRTSDVR